MEHILHWFILTVCVGNVIAQRFSYGKFYFIDVYTLLLSGIMVKIDL